MLTPSTSFSWFRNREKDLIPYFSQTGELVYCNDIPDLIKSFKIETTEFLTDLYKKFQVPSVHDTNVEYQI